MAVCVAAESSRPLVGSPVQLLRQLQHQAPPGFGYGCAAVAPAPPSPQAGAPRPPGVPRPLRIHDSFQAGDAGSSSRHWESAPSTPGLSNAPRSSLGGGVFDDMHGDGISITPRPPARRQHSQLSEAGCSPGRPQPRGSSETPRQESSLRICSALAAARSIRYPLVSPQGCGGPAPPLQTPAHVSEGDGPAWSPVSTPSTVPLSSPGGVPLPPAPRLECAAPPALAWAAEDALTSPFALDAAVLEDPESLPASRKRCFSASTHDRADAEESRGALRTDESRGVLGQLLQKSCSTAAE
eukprot:TRINITY_DN30614_c0_g1_i1.p1 TRINITY_DN30614_c0_g1~~TRINITY_DN30614_c0_g1_i1.p1  ORF type:complete len:297 (+),score=19.15 TRINITY_DN30614_c0_g1_i1:106-996(+)